MDCVGEVLRLGRRNGCLNILNPAPARKLPESLFPLIDVMTPNGTEARILLGLEPNDPASPETLAERLRSLGVARVIITLGAEGALLVDASGSRRIPSFGVNAVDPTGAGDTFNGVLAAGFARGLSVDEAVFRATRAGAYATQTFGTIAAIPTAAELESLIQNLL